MLSNGFWRDIHVPQNMKGLIEKAKNLVVESRQPSTVKKYLLYFKMFARWCQGHSGLGFLPASGVTVGLYLTDLVGSSTSLSRFYGCVYGIKWAHRWCGFEDPTQHHLPSLVIEAAKRRLSKKVQIKVPLTPKIIRLLLEKFWDISNVRKSRFVNMVLLAFHGFLRINELRNLKRSDLVFAGSHLKIILHKNKSDVYGAGAEVLIATTGGSYCPTKNLELFLLLTDNFSSGDMYLFRKLDGDKMSSLNLPMTYTEARAELKFYLSQVVSNEADFSWHSFRHGGASAAASKGVPDRLLKRHGRWRSDSAKDGYIHDDLEARLSVSSKLCQ